MPGTGKKQKRQGQREEARVVRLTRKLAEMIDGVDLASAHVGDRLLLSEHDAEVLIAEGWAEDAERRRRRTRARR